jgi:hypothetical protein
MGLAWVVMTIVNIGVSAVVLGLVAIVAVLIFVGHPRPWWTHSTFDVDGYIASDLVPRINRNVDQLVALKHAAEADVGHPVRSMSVSADGGLSFKESTSNSDPITRSVARDAYDLMARSCPSLATLSHTAYTRSDFTAGLADLGDAASVRNSGPHAYNLLITQAADACGLLTRSVCDSYLGLLLLISREDMRNLQLDHTNVGLANLTRAYAGAQGPESFLAHIGHCAGAGEGGLEEHGVVAKRVACALLALVDLGYLYTVVVPQVRSMRYSRRAQGFFSVFWLFFNPYKVQWLAKQAELQRTFKDAMRGLDQSRFVNTINAFISKLKATIY